VSSSSPLARLRARDIAGYALLAMLLTAVALGVVKAFHAVPNETQVTLVLLTIAMALPVPLLARRAGLRWRRLFGAAPSRRELRLALVAFPVAIVTMASALLFYIPLSYVAPRFVAKMLLENDAFDIHTLPQWMLLMLGGVLLAPLLEELLFRGILMQRWSHRWGTRTGVIASSALFAVLHGEWLGHFVFGVAMSLLYLRTRKLWLPVAAHALNNLAVMGPSLHDVLVPDTSPPATIESFREQIVWAAPVLALALAAFWLYRRFVWGDTSVRALLAGPVPYEASAQVAVSPVPPVLQAPATA
jgi:membrane protease YdiL (CAAX protease family)